MGDHILVGIILVIIILGVGYRIADPLIENKCLAHGYPNHRVSWTFKGYCIKEVNETEVVVPSGELE